MDWTPNRPLTNDEIYFLSQLDEGKENIVTKTLLTRITGFNQRKMRELSNALRKAEVPVIYFSNAKGYCLAKDYWELQEFIESEIDSRTFDYLEQKKALKNCFKDRQMRFELNG